MIGVLAVVAHGLVELPLEFAYFLVPLGVARGMVRALSPPSPPALARPRWPIPAAGAALAAALLVVAFDYLRAEENFRLARLQTARIGTDRVSADVPDLLVLTQLQAYLRFVRTEARPGLPPEDLQWMQQVAERYGFAPVLFRYALALGLNGRPEEAARTLKLLCHVHATNHCVEAREVWPAQQERHPALRAVPAP